jgi:hypothetical protein
MLLAQVFKSDNFDSGSPSEAAEVYYTRHGAKTLRH